MAVSTWHFVKERKSSTALLVGNILPVHTLFSEEIWSLTRSPKMPLCNYSDVGRQGGGLFNHFFGGGTDSPETTYNRSTCTPFTILTYSHILHYIVVLQ